jgi:cysteine desulfurase
MSEAKRIYLDHAATTPTRPEVVEAMRPYFTDAFGNPSSFHSEGRDANEAIESAREIVAGHLGARPEEIVFTSGGTESDNYAIEGIAFACRERGRHIVTTGIEHHAVLETCEFLETQGFHFTALPVSREGLVDPEDVKKAITDETVLVSVMHANNEVGTIQPIAEIGTLCRARGIPLHTDAVQTVGHIPTLVDDLNVDLLSLSAHKFHGPKGVGALYVRRGTKLTRFLHGGGQEEGRRASTQNVPGIVGLGRALELAGQEMEPEIQRLTKMRDDLWRGIDENNDHVFLNGHPTLRLPNNVNFSIEAVEGEATLLALDIEGVAASTGSACSSGSLEASHVTLALGLTPELARSSIRFSLGLYTTEEDVARVVEMMPPIVSRLRAVSPLRPKT